MSIRSGLLALLGEAPAYGYQLKSAFEARTGNTWPLNIGQVYTTLARLERDGLVAGAGSDDEGREMYAITAAGRAEVRRWFATPVPRRQPPRDELAIKLALAVDAPQVDVRALVQVQRAETMHTVQELTRLKVAAGAPDGEGDLAWLLMVDALIFTAEAEVRWLDHCETRLARAAGRRRRTATAAASAPAAEDAAERPGRGLGAAARRGGQR